MNITDSSKSAEFPEGVLNKEVLKSFMGITGPENNLQYTRGHERIPDNWYKRNDLAQYSLPYFLADFAYFLETQPEILDVGCNTGKINTYTSIDISALTGGTYDKSNIAQYTLCFATEYAIASLTKNLGLVGTLLSTLTSSLRDGLQKAGMTCPSITNLDESQFDICPGFGFYGGESAPIAPGAIQS